MTPKPLFAVELVIRPRGIAITTDSRIRGKYAAQLFAMGSGAAQTAVTTRGDIAGKDVFIRLPFSPLRVGITSLVVQGEVQGTTQHPKETPRQRHFAYSVYSLPRASTSRRGPSRRRSIPYSAYSFYSAYSDYSAYSQYTARPKGDDPKPKRPIPSKSAVKRGEGRRATKRGR